MHVTMNLWIWKETSIFCHILLQNIDFERKGGATTIRFLYHIGVTHTEGKWGRILTHNHPLLSEYIPFWEEKCFCKKERVWGDKCKWKGNIDLEAHTKIYTNPSQSADFGTTENTADCEIRRFRDLWLLVNGTKSFSKVNILTLLWLKNGVNVNEFLIESWLKLGFQLLISMEFEKC